MPPPSSSSNTSLVRGTLPRSRLIACISCPGTSCFPGEPWILSSGNSVESQPGCRGARRPRSALRHLQSLSAHSRTTGGHFCGNLCLSVGIDVCFPGVRPGGQASSAPTWAALVPTPRSLMSPRQQREAWLPPSDTRSLETPRGTWRASALVVPPTLMPLFFSALCLCVLHTEST